MGLSAEPLLVYPTHYTGEPGYVTDTEDSDIADDVVVKSDMGIEVEKKKPDSPEVFGPAPTHSSTQRGDHGEL